MGADNRLGSSQPLNLAGGISAFPAHRYREGPFYLLDPRQAAAIREKMHDNAMALGREHDVRERCQISLGFPRILKLGAGQ